MSTSKTAFVTGASRGIGYEIAITLAQENMFVIGSSTTQKGADNFSQQLKSQGLQGEGVVLNVANRNELADVSEKLLEKYTAVDVLVNNAAITRDNLFIRMTDEQWDEVINTNLTSAFQLVKKLIKPMVKNRWGRIINVSSVIGSTGNAGQSNYAAAKAGVIAFSKSLAKELAARGITVNAVAPGFIDTDMTKVLSNEQKEAIKKQIPMQQMGTPKDIAQAVAFLASDNAAYITGHTLHVNGGMYMG